MMASREALHQVSEVVGERLREELTGTDIENVRSKDLVLAAAAASEIILGANALNGLSEDMVVTVFGSARVPESSPLYEVGVSLGESLASSNMKVVTGGGPGMMRAVASGAGPAASIGINIDLPYERAEFQALGRSPSSLEMKYFFTRKIAMTRASKAFVALPGGYGTLDEVFEVVTLLSTGKIGPLPLILLDEPGGNFWSKLHNFLVEQIHSLGMISSDELSFWHIANSPSEVVDIINTFYSNFVEFSYGSGVGTIRLKTGLNESQFQRIRANFPTISFIDNGANESLAFEFAERRFSTINRLIMSL